MLALVLVRGFGVVDCRWQPRVVLCVGRAARVCLLSTSVHARPRAAAYVAQIPRRADAGVVYMRSTLWLYADGEGVRGKWRTEASVPC